MHAPKFHTNRSTGFRDLKVPPKMNAISAIIRVPHDNGFESSKRGKCSLCRQKESKHKNLEIRKQLYESRLDHTPKCQSWATSIVGYRSLKKFYKEDHLDHVMRYSMFISVLEPQGVENAW